MQILSLSEVKMKLSELVDAVSGTDDAIMITKHGRPAAVLISSDEYESWTETEAIRFDAPLMAEIRAGLKALKENRANLYTLEELFDEEPATNGDLNDNARA
jgi:antitoxin YefM